ncbi:hypothetical protein SRHO_G00001960 [Serrasalmus rhombeus]
MHRIRLVYSAWRLFSHAVMGRPLALRMQVRREERAGSAHQRSQSGMALVSRSPGKVRPGSVQSSSVAMWTTRVYRRGVFTSGLAHQLVEAVTEVLHLAGAQDTPYTHQLAMAWWMMTPYEGMATASQACLVRPLPFFSGCSCYRPRGVGKTENAHWILK